MKSIPRLLMIMIDLAIFVSTALAAGPQETVLYNFKGGADGANPFAGLVADHAGNLFGTTDSGGNGCAGGCGTVFQLSLGQGNTWTEKVIYAFGGGSDGSAPSASLIFDAAGRLYGTTASGGLFSDGTVFQLSPQGGSWVETVLYSFGNGNDGAYPLSPLIFDAAGNLYGTTLFGGGAMNAGIVFQLSPPAQQGDQWVETVLHPFGYGNDGLDPMSGVLMDNRGALSGTTIDMVFKLIPPAPGQTTWTERLLSRFGGGGSNGSQPCSLVAGKGGILYGTTNLGGSPANAGTVFQITPQGGGRWTETTLYSFTGDADGGLPCGQLVIDRSGNLYGTSSGNGQNIPGTLFQLTPPAQQGGAWAETTLHDFVGGADGFTPVGGVIFGKGGALYGTTELGGSFGKGTVYQVIP